MEATTIISTEHLKPKEIIGYWNDVVAQIYAPCHNITLRNNFNARAEVTEFGLTELSYIESCGVNYQRTTHNIRQDHKDDIFISVMLKGIGYFTQFDTQVKQSEGDILIHDSAYPYLYQYPNRYRSIFYKIPRTLLDGKLANINKLGGTVIPKNSPCAHAISSFLHSAHTVSTESDIQLCSELSVPITSLLSIYLRKATYQSNNDVYDKRHELLLSNIRAFMMDNLLDGSLDLQVIAEQQHISVRTLNRLFAEVGETPMQWLQSKRLTNAHQMLINMPYRSITDIALMNGFNDLSYFGRLFRRQFGQSPSMVRTNNRTDN